MKLCKDCRHYYAYNESWGMDMMCKRPGLINGRPSHIRDVDKERGVSQIYEICGPEAKFFEAGEHPLMAYAREHKMPGRTT